MCVDGSRVQAQKEDVVMENMNTNESLESALTHKIPHTPGPWLFDESNYGICNRHGYGLLDSHGETLGVTVHTTDVFHMPIKESTANAKLIAAAPTMLNALRRIVRYQDLIGGSMASMSSTRHIAAQAIQPATGETV